ncbi:uncharacterized protein LOC117122594 [Anneissia japonica]|uniref:uncharacterized protein LOC117122594 n=1 Tax=Anneissia japonica TaxID=1529436 RepID=UPI0014256729|nr:uncharacterized protein LOC117122594 [Anneissia japonica]
MPKRKRKDGKPGRQYQILTMYSEIPSDAEALKNGHILHQITVQATKADVLRFFKDKFNIVITHNTLQSLLTRSVKRYVNLAREADERRFKDVCDAAFTSYDLVAESAPAGSVPESVPAASASASRSLDFKSCADEEITSGIRPSATPLPSAPKSPVSSASIRSLKRKGLLTPMKKKILERGEEMRKEVNTLKNKVTVLRAQLSSKKFKQNRYLQRQVSRLYERLRIKADKLKKSEEELREIKKSAVEEHVRKELANAKRRIRRIKKQHKNCPSQRAFQKMTDKNRELKRKLKEKEDRESEIEDRVLQLEEELNILR